MKYSEKLKDPRWQKKRLEIFERDRWSCQGCGDRNSTLHIHHTHYSLNTDPWDYSNDVLITLCDMCHAFEHAKKTCPSCGEKRLLYIDDGREVCLSCLSAFGEGWE